MDKLKTPRDIKLYNNVYKTNLYIYKKLAKVYGIELNLEKFKENCKKSVMDGSNIYEGLL